MPDATGRRIRVFGMPARRPDGDAALVVGAERHLDQWVPDRDDPRRVPLGDVGQALTAIEDAHGPVWVLASGDPGFFGIVRVLAERFGPAALDVHPAPSSVSLAFGRLGLPWDDAAVVSAHGRPLDDAARRAAVSGKAAVLTAPGTPPEALGRALLELGSRQRVVVCSKLGEAGEQVEAVDLAGLAAGTWDPCSVVVLLPPDANGVAPAPSLAWGRPEDAFAHREGMVTKAEVRAVVLGKLGLLPAGVVWDVGTGSGSVAVECAALAPAARVIAIDADPAACAQARQNARRHGVALDVVEGRAPAVLAALPDPDRAFVGGGGMEVLDAVRARLRPGGRMVATFAALDRAAAAHARLGHLCQVAVSRGEPLPDGAVRLAAENPVFVAWGPDA